MESKKIKLDSDYSIFQKFNPLTESWIWCLINRKGFIVGIKKSKALIIEKYEALKGAQKNG